MTYGSRQSANNKSFWPHSLSSTREGFFHGVFTRGSRHVILFKKMSYRNFCSDYIMKVYISRYILVLQLYNNLKQNREFL